MKQAQMDSILTVAPHKDGWYSFSNHQEIRSIDEATGAERISYIADALWQKECPTDAPNN